MLWRVGRHRLAWRPTRRAGLHAYNPFGMREDETVETLSWIATLLATIVVLPWRIVTNRWPVVAYVINPIDVEGQRRRSPAMPRAEAKALVRQWAAYIERYGEPPPLPDSARSAGSWSPEAHHGDQSAEPPPPGDPPGR
jgi:hypothetical protein